MVKRCWSDQRLSIVYSKQFFIIFLFFFSVKPIFSVDLLHVRVKINFFLVAKKILLRVSRKCLVTIICTALNFKHVSIDCKSSKIEGTTSKRKFNLPENYFSNTIIPFPPITLKSVDIGIFIWKDEKYIVSQTKQFHHLQLFFDLLFHFSEMIRNYW